jgi:hypothetical protein
MFSIPIPNLPYETSGSCARPKGLVVGCITLAALTALEILTFSVGGFFAVLTSYLWFAIGAFSFAYMCWSYLVALTSDLRRGSIWGLLPLAAALPVCFFNIDSFTFLNTESLSELHSTFGDLQKPDHAYTSVFWASYPSRSLVLNLIPTALVGVTPWAYRAGFSYPIFFGSLFLFAAIRRYHIRERGASAVAALVSSGIFAYPMFCQISRTFEMAISSVSFGMWAISALLLFAAQPSATSAIVAAWSIGLLSASFTSGLGLVALLWALLGIWGARAFIRRDRSVATLVFATLINCVVVGVSLYLIRPKTLRIKQIPVSEMVHNFSEALGYTFSLSQSVFGPAILVIPTALAFVFAVSLRSGALPLILSLWCFPVIWSATNLHGKIGPQLPFALYRSLIIIPVLLYVIGRLVLWILARLERFTWAARALPLVLAVALFMPLRNTYNAQGIFKPARPPEGREVVTLELVNFITQNGLSPFSDAWIANRTDEKSIENFLPCLQYFFLNWTRIDRSTPLPQAPNDKRTGVIITMQDDPLATQPFPGYQVTVQTIPARLNPSKQVVLTAVVLRRED